MIKAIVVVTPAERARLKAEMNGSLHVVGEFATLPDARSAAIDADAILIAKKPAEPRGDFDGPGDWDHVDGDAGSFEEPPRGVGVGRRGTESGEVLDATKGTVRRDGGRETALAVAEGADVPRAGRAAGEHGVARPSRESVSDEQPRPYPRAAPASTDALRDRHRR